MRSRRLLLNTAANISAQAIATVIAIVSLPLLLRAFGQVTYGVFLLASSTVSLIALFDFGVGLTTVRMVASHLETDEPEKLSSVVNSALLIHAGIGVIAAAALVTMGVFVELVFRVGPIEAELLRRMLWIHALAQLVVWPATAMRHVLAGHERYTHIVAVTVGVTLGNALAIVVVLISNQGPLALTAAQASVTALGSIALAIMALKTLPMPLRSGRIERPAINHIFTLSLPIFTVQVAAFMMRQQTDRLVLGVFAGAAAVAIYEAAAKLGSLAAQMNELTTSAMLPYMTRRDVGSGGEGMARTFLIGTRYTGLLLLPVVAALAAIAPELIRVWVGPQLGNDVGTTTVAAQLLILSQAGLVLYSVADPILIGKGRYHRWTPYAVGLAVLNLVLSVLLVRGYGVVGVAVGTFVACLLEAPLYLRVVRQEVGVRLQDWLAQTLAPSLSVAVAAALAVFGLRWLLHPTSLWSVGAILAGVVLLAWTIVVGGVLSTEERQLVRGAFARGEA